MRYIFTIYLFWCHIRQYFLPIYLKCLNTWTVGLLWLKNSNVVHELTINVFNDVYQVVWIPGCTHSWTIRNSALQYKLYALGCLGVSAVLLVNIHKLAQQTLLVALTIATQFFLCQLLHRLGRYSWYTPCCIRSGTIVHDNYRQQGSDNCTYKICAWCGKAR